jgi:gamma-glutamylcyclotransferase (GGCT)/AIG2-like uncharacterized protein YtfP
MTSSGIYKLFVYGSLRRGFHSHVYEYISRYFTLVGDAKVKGKLFDMGSYPAGIPAEEEVFIVGELYQIKHENEFSWAFGQLDDYEGVNVEEDEMQLYRHEITEVIYNGQITKAWIYWFNGEVSGRPVIASGDMIEYLNQKKSS